MKFLVLAGVLLGSSAVLVGARLGTASENDNADSSAAATNERHLAQSSQHRRRLDIINKMFSGMLEDVGAITAQLDQYVDDISDSMSSGMGGMGGGAEFDLSSIMDLMGDTDSFGDMSSIVDAMMNPVNFTDIYDRCCGSNVTILPGTTQYDSTAADNTTDSSCRCPVRNVFPFETKWDGKCVTSVGPKALAEISGEATPKTGFELFMEAMGGKDMDKDMGSMMGGNFDFGSLMGGGGDDMGGFGDAFGDIMESFFGPVDYIDIQDRCCPNASGDSAYDLDPSVCTCPVRNNTKFLAKWDEQCDTKIAAKAQEQLEGGAGETDGSGGMGMGMGDMMGGSDLDLESLFESLFGKSVNYTQVYDNCCETDASLFPTAYAGNTAACKCPVRQTNPKWETACADKIIPKVLEL